MKQIIFSILFLAIISPKVKLTKAAKSKESRTNLCSLCECATNHKIICFFKEQVTLNNQYFMSKTTSSLIVNLSSSTNLKLEHGFFNDNKLNRLLINGTHEKWPDGKNSVEIGNNTFHGNYGPFPEIEITHANILILQEQSLFGEFMLNINNCEKVIIMKNAFDQTQFKATFQGIHDLRIHSKAFSGTQNSQIEILSSNINALSEIDTSLRSIYISNCTMEKITSHTFNVNHIDSFVIVHSKIGSIETKAITEKLYCQLFEISDCDIRAIEPMAISGSGMSEFLLNKNRIQSIGSKAIYFTGIEVSISDNTVKFVDKGWLQIANWSNITIYNNTFGKYNSINIEKSTESSNCRFERNYITDAAISSLNFPNKNCVLKDIYFYRLCSCDLSWLKKLGDRILYGDIYCRLNEPLNFCFNSSTLNLLKYVQQICDPSAGINCQKNQEQKDKKAQREFLTINEDSNNHIMMFWALSVLVAFIISILGICFYRRVRSSSRIISVNGTDTLLSRDNNFTNQFSEDDRLVIRESLEQIEKKQPDIFAIISGNTRKLLEQTLSETEKVLTIGEIVRAMDGCQFVSDNMAIVAFTDILYKHLAPRNNNRSISLSSADETNLLELDHIYAEPQNLQPAFSEIYNYPVDRTEIEIYSEPFQ